MSSAAPPSSISLWARPDGIIGKQFSFGSTTQSKITGASEKIESYINLMLPLGLVEVSRTGIVAIARGPEGT